MAYPRQPSSRTPTRLPGTPGQHRISPAGTPVSWRRGPGRLGDRVPTRCRRGIRTCWPGRAPSTWLRRRRSRRRTRWWPRAGRVCAERRHPRSDGPRRALRVLDQGSVPGRAAREPGDPGRRRLATHTRRAAALARARGRAAGGHPYRLRAHARARRPVRHPPARRHRLQGALAGHQRPVHRGAGHRPALGRPGRSRPLRDRRPPGVRRRRRAARCGHVAGVRHLPGPRLRPESGASGAPSRSWRRRSSAC